MADWSSYLEDLGVPLATGGVINPNALSSEYNTGVTVATGGVVNPGGPLPQDQLASNVKQQAAGWWAQHGSTVKLAAAGALGVAVILAALAAAVVALPYVASAKELAK